MKEKELSNTIIIRDPFLEPFYIQKDTYCYTVMEDATPDQRYTDSVKKIQKTIGYYSTLGNCLKRISGLKINNKQEYNSITEYISEWKEIELKIKTLVNLEV
jgi:hypothetical protein